MTMENTDGESLSSAFSRCVIQLRRTIRSYVVEPTVEPQYDYTRPTSGHRIVNQEGRNARATGFIRMLDTELDDGSSTGTLNSIPSVSSSYASCATRTEQCPLEVDDKSPSGTFNPASSASTSYVSYMTRSERNSDDESVITAVRDDYSPKPLDVVDPTPILHEANDDNSRLVRVPEASRLTRYSDKLTEFALRIMGTNDWTSPYSTPMASWMIQPSEEELMSTLEWRLPIILDTLGKRMHLTHSLRIAMAKAFIHTRRDHEDQLIAMATVGGIALLLRASHLSRSPEEMLSFMRCQTEVLNRELFDKLNDAQLARCLLTDVPPDHVDYQTHVRLCAAVTVRAMYGVAYTMSGSIGVAQLDSWLQCAKCYGRAIEAMAVQSKANQMIDN